MRNSGLQRLEAVVERKQRLAPERRDRRFLFEYQDGGMSGLRPYRPSAMRPVALLLNGRRANPMPSGELPYALSTPLYHPTDCPCRCGAAMNRPIAAPATRGGRSYYHSAGLNNNTSASKTPSPGPLRARHRTRPRARVYPQSGRSQQSWTATNDRSMARYEIKCRPGERGGAARQWRWHLPLREPQKRNRAAVDCEGGFMGIVRPAIHNKDGL